jgi:arylsulfatase A-like enzyme
MLSRRHFLSLPGAAAAAPHSRPNILLLLADNWACPHASAYRDPVVRSPAFDRLAAEGALFTHAFAPTPSCSPSRSSLLSGRPAHALGPAANLYGPLSTSVPLYTELLDAAGYDVGFAGKGWGPGAPKEAGRTRNPAGTQYDGFDDFLARHDPARPFCFWFGSHDPHVPWNRNQQRKASMDARKIAIPPHVPDHPTVREDILNYYCEVEAFDAECGEILDRLRERKLLDNTLVVMTSDNGWQIPRGLGNCYDLGVRVPLAARWPERVRRGVVSDAFVKLDDLFPTFLEAAALKPPAVAAKSLWPLLEGGAQAGRDHIFLERERHANVRRGDLSYPVRGIRTRDWLYLRNLAPDRNPAGDPELYWAVGPYGDVDPTPTRDLLLDPANRERFRRSFDLCFGLRPAEELYDLKRDPGQVENLATKPGHASIRAELSRRVDRWMSATADPRANGWTDFFDRVPYTGARAKTKKA